MKKSTKRFILSTEAKNSNGFRVRTAGINLADFKSNPLLLWLHKRPKGERADEILPLGRWEDIELKDGVVSAVPVFDEDDEFAMRIYKKVENGSLKMASAGLLPLEFSETEGDKWLERSTLKEASICDIGSNSEAVTVALYNESDELVKLSEVLTNLNQNTEIPMKLIQLTASTMALLKLSDGATETDAHTAIAELVTLSQTQGTQIKTLESEKDALQLKLDEAENAGKDAKIIALVDKAVEDRKITADQKEGMIKLANADFDAAKAHLDSIPSTPTASSQMKTDAPAGDELMKLTYSELDKAGKLETLKEKNLEGFKAKFKEQFGVDYKL
ncbi:hypothetical protein [Leeuwenhoekiella sp.]|uniref:hypothetical protein n=1 Tax=Leeuwenhoekiella sp. TaxID=1977054 RepID=UPI000C683774|nr:hypothetical protein [Leeuwenhoekiella sp.]MAO42154.1 hypothetical protein [Leeuwenhoekiella sp.]